MDAWPWPTLGTRSEKVSSGETATALAPTKIHSQFGEIMFGPKLSDEPLQAARPLCKVHVGMAWVVQGARPRPLFATHTKCLDQRQSGTIQGVRPARVSLALN